MKSQTLFFALLLGLSLTVQSAIPEFASFTDVNQKKAAFFDYMYPLILAENKKILADRAIVKNGEASAQLTRICKKYSKNCDIIDAKKRKQLLSRVDVIPPSLAMAQGANESAWGTSRFAKKGRNYFGQWCYTKGCGIVPARREKGTNHEVRKFANVQQSVGAYIFNLNTGRVYQLIRKQRVEARKASVNPTGYDLAKGLIKYSQRREAYVKEIRSMISYNKLVKKYDKKFWVELKQ
ncbi:MAG: Bax protein [Gammaproteobacteria bacterium]|jgi:Bax protein